jgi:putative transposase
MQPTNQYQFFHRRDLPHIQPSGEAIFVTFSLNIPTTKEYANLMKSIKLATITNRHKTTKDVNERNLIINKKLFAMKDNYYDHYEGKANILQLPNCAQIVFDEMHLHDKQLYDLLAFTIMPNHVHCLFKSKEGESGLICSIAYIMNTVKGRSARFINKELGRSGKLWQTEYYDHYVRDGNELNNIIRYIVMNPCHGLQAVYESAGYRTS